MKRLLALFAVVGLFGCESNGVQNTSAPAHESLPNAKVLASDAVAPPAPPPPPPPMPVYAEPAPVYVVPLQSAAPYVAPTGNESETYDPQPENSVQRASENPVSTFSIDVDTASYAVMRRDLNAGLLPRKDAIRVEELVNYFPYDYPAPSTPSVPFETTVSVVPNPWNSDTRLLHIGLKGYVPPSDTRPPANLVLLIDVSGSMANDKKLPLLKRSFKLLLETLDQEDRVAIVTYSTVANVVLESTPATERRRIEEALDSLVANGGTAGGDGLKFAYEQAEAHFDPDAINRILLATDGDFNIGRSTPDAMKDLIAEKRDKGIFMSVLGFGVGNYNDAIMQAIAQNGNGIAAYIDTLSEARKVLVEESGSAMVPIASDVKVQVEFNPAQISEYRLIGYETRALNREDFTNDKVDAGDINSGHSVTALYEITPAGSSGERIEPLRYSSEPTGTNSSDELAFVRLRYKRIGSDFSTEISRAVTADYGVATFDEASAETQFAIAVASFAQMLRGSRYTEEFAYDDVIEIANASRGEDEFGYRAEFVSLVRLARDIAALQ